MGHIGVEPDANQPQIAAARAAIERALGSDDVVGVYLYGSAVSEGGLRPDSDLDIFVLGARPLRRAQKRQLIDALLPISGRETRPPAWRPLEVTVVAQPEVRPWRYPPRWELQYGEWLRGAFLAGDLEAWPAVNPDLAVLISMVRSMGKSITGPPPAEVLDPVPPNDLAHAMLDEVPRLLGDLEADTRNVLLTLARVWITLVTGEFRTKDEAAAWADDRLPNVHRPILAQARDLYLAGGYGRWTDPAAVRACADAIAGEIRALSA